MGSEILDVMDVPLTAREPNCIVPLTPEPSLWLTLLKDQSVSEARVGGASVRIVGPLDIFLLRQCLQEIVRKHEALRTRILTIDGAPIQVIDASCDVDLQFIELTDANDIGNDVERLSQEFLREKINLSRGPLFTVRLLRLSHQEHVMLVGIDHFVADVTSGSIVRRDIWTLYSQLARRIQPLPTESAIQFGDYAVWQQKLDSVWKQRHEAYWTKRLDKQSCMELPSGHGATTLRDPEVLVIDVPFGRDLITKLRTVSLQTRVPLSLVTLAVFVVLLSNWCHERDLLLQYRAHGRDIHRDLADTCGFLATPIYLRIQLPPSTTFIDVIHIVNGEYLSSRGHMDFGRLSAIIPDLKSLLHFNWMYAKLAHRPTYRIEQHVGSLMVDSFPIRRTQFAATKSSWRGFGADIRPQNFDLKNGLTVTLWYQNSDFSTEFMQTVGRNLRLFAEELADHPGSLTSSLLFRTAV